MRAGQCIQCAKSTCTVRSSKTECQREGQRGPIGRDEHHVCEALSPLREPHEIHVLVQQMDIHSGWQHNHMHANTQMSKAAVVHVHDDQSDW